MVLQQVYVIWWRYSDGSSAGVLRAYADQQRAQEDMDLLTTNEGSKEYKIEELPIYWEGKPRSYCE